MWNYSGVKDPAVDCLIDRVVYAKSEADRLSRTQEMKMNGWPLLWWFDKEKNFKY